MIWLSFIYALFLSCLLTIIGRRKLKRRDNHEKVLGLSLLLISLALSVLGITEAGHTYSGNKNFNYGILATGIFLWTFIFVLAGSLHKLWSDKILTLTAAFLFSLWLIMKDASYTLSDAILFMGIITVIVSYLPGHLKKERGR